MAELIPGGIHDRAPRGLVRVLAWRRQILAVAGLLALALAPGPLRLETDNSPRTFFLHGSPRVERYRELQGLFGGDEALRIVLQGDGLWTRDGLAWLERLEEAAGKLPGVEGTSSLASVGRPARDLGLAPWPPADPEAFRQRSRSDPLARRLGWIDADGQLATVLLRLAPGPHEEQRRLLRALEDLLASPPPGLAAEIVGLAVLERALDGSSREIGQRYFPLLILFTVVLLAAIFRDPRYLAPPLAFVAIGELLVLGPMGYLGVRLNLVLSILPPLLFVIGVATAVHVLLAFRQRTGSGLSPQEAVAEVYQDKGWAILWTGITTLIGFGSLAASPVAAVRDLGLWSAIGVAGMTLTAFTLYPALLVSWAGSGRRGPARRRLEKTVRRWGRAGAEGAARRRRPLLAALALVAAGAAFGLPRLRVETNALTYLPAHHPARAGIEGLEARGVGTAMVELILTLSEQGGDFRDPEKTGRLTELSRRLGREPEVYAAVSAGDVLAALQRFLEAVPGGLPALLRGPVETSAESALSPFLSPDRRTARITLFTPVFGYDRLRPVEAVALTAAGEIFPEARAEVSGQFPLLLEAQHRLLGTLGISLSVTLLCVAGIFRFLLGSTRLTLLALVPNLWPVLGVLGAMGWFEIPLDIATVMVASVLLGLAVDDTIHTLGHFRELAPRRGLLEAVAGTLEMTAPAYLLTGVILGAGFGVCALSGFAPTARFGLLSAGGIALAVLGDLFLLPALLGSTPRGAMAKLGFSVTGPEATGREKD